jgi:hypothetical protein
MPVIVVTRLRLTDPALPDELVTDAVAAIERAMKSGGNLGADALADANKRLVERQCLARTPPDAGLRGQRAAPGHQQAPGSLLR